jgi:16S rRNA (guanine(1405)-N(7))-methyltransferase
MTMDNDIQYLANQVQASAKYQNIYRELVLRLAQESVQKGLKGKAAIKSIRSKLHQVGGAYFKRGIDYLYLIRELQQLPKNIEQDHVKSFCLKSMKLHASTAERLPILEDFFQTALAPIAPINNVLDLACGLNPLAIPWMPLAPDFTYQACDIYLDMLDFLEQFFTHFQIDGRVKPCDLSACTPKMHAQVAFLLKSIPCLEQVDKNIGLKLLEDIPAQHVLVSFPVRSLGGQKKGMHNFYRDHFYELVNGQSWKTQEFTFSTEIAFLVSK